MLNTAVVFVKLLAKVPIGGMKDFHVALLKTSKSANIPKAAKDASLSITKQLA